MRALDLFCGAGGATRGLVQAGFEEVVGVDIRFQPNWFKAGGTGFIRQDATEVPIGYIRTFDFVWASPPCQKHTAMKTMPDHIEHECFIDRTRERLMAAGVPYAIENVVGAPLVDPVILCATNWFAYDDCYELRRHRLVETSWPLFPGGPLCMCAHQPGRDVLGIYGGHVRNRRRRPGSRDRGVEDPPRKKAEELMGIDWMTLSELSEAIPPVYARAVARDWMLRAGK